MESDPYYKMPSTESDIVNYADILNRLCEIIESEIMKLPQSVNEIDISPPGLNDETIYIPLECTFNKKFYARAYLLRNHQIENQIISELGILQYQIPIKKQNEPLLLCIYASHFMNEIFSHTDAPIGTNKCDNIKESAKNSSYILSLLDDAQIIKTTLFEYCFKKQPKPVGLSCKDELAVLQVQNLLCDAYKKHFSQKANQFLSRCKLMLEKWANDRLAEVYALSETARYITWKSEYRLYQYIKLFCTDAIYQYRTEWLERQSLDVYIPSLKCAIEYQGKQHYEAIDYFGGENRLIYNILNDQNKREKCCQNGIKLFYWEYSQKLNFNNVTEFMNTYILPAALSKKVIENNLTHGVPFLACDLFGS